MSYPVELRHRIQATLPSVWPGQKEAETVTGPGFKFVSDINLDQRRLTLDYRWTTTADRVEATDAPEYGRKISEVIDSLGYQLTYDERLVGSTGFRLKDGFSGWTAATFLASLVGLLWFTWKSPPESVARRAAAVEDPKLAAIGGWLIFMAFGVCLAPYLSGRALWDVSRVALNQSVWDAITTPGRTSYEPWYRLLAGIEVLGDAAHFAVALFLPVLFFRRHFRFPAVMCVGWILQIIIMVAIISLQDEVSFLTAADRTKNISALIGLLSAVGLWLPYFLRSRRVRATFFRGWRGSSPPPLPAFGSIAIQPNITGPLQSP